MDAMAQILGFFFRAALTGAVILAFKAGLGF
jgi:hypothetical protein